MSSFLMAKPTLFFGEPVLALSPGEVSRVDPKEGCSVVGAATEGLFCLFLRAQRLILHPPPTVSVHD